MREEAHRPKGQKKYRSLLGGKEGWGHDVTALARPRLYAKKEDSHVDEGLV
jgi:hypothetical protein